MAISENQIRAVLAEYIDPYTRLDLLSAKALRNLNINGDDVGIDIILGYPAAGFRDRLIADLAEQLKSIPGIGQISIKVSWKIAAHVTQQAGEPIKGVKNIIAIASGKGGVGKSTTAVNLALALAAEGAVVGILDADIYGPSQPMMLGASTHPESKDQKTLEPVVRHGIQSMSIGYLIDVNTPMVWRGPMVSSALQQLLNDTNWQDVDYLVIDLPPGTGDIQLTLSQKIPVSGAVIVTTPQDIALLDARKALEMFNKVRIPVLGIVENMSTHLCTQCGHEEAIFGIGGGQRMAQQTQVDLLGSLPLDIRIREEADQGHPTVAARPDTEIAKKYRDIALRIAAKLSLQAKRQVSKFPKIVIE